VAQDIKFAATGAAITKAGWRELFLLEDKEQEEAQQEEAQPLPKLAVGDSITGSIALTEGKTTPPKLFTEASLIAYMMSCGKEVADKELKKILVDKEGIGRPATRRAIIDTLLSKRKYVERQKKYIVPTELGVKVYALVKHLSIVNVALTAQWEQKLDQIEAGALTAKQFDSEMRRFTTEIVREIQQMKAPEMPLTSSSSNDLKSPKCKKKTASVFEFTKKDTGKKHTAIHCKDKQCGWAYWNNPVCGKTLSAAQLEKMVAKGKTDTIKGFTSKTSGKTFDSHLALKEDLTGVKFQF
jgi:DNA topoisomerase-3